MYTYKIYFDTCIKTDKTYIGYTKHDIANRWYSKVHKAKTTNLDYKLLNAIRKYGETNWTHGYIYMSYDMNHILEMEQYFISQYDSYHNGYNSTIGGEVPINTILSNEHKESISIGLRKAYSSGARKPVSHNKSVRNKISDSKSTGIWVTPYGDFKSSNKAAIACDTTRPTLTSVCRNPNKIVSRCNSLFTESDIGKTHCELGFGFIPNSN